MKKHNSNKSNILQALAVLLFVSIINYSLVRAIFIIYAQYLFAEKVLAILFFLAEIFVMFHALCYFMNVYRRSREETEDLNRAVLKDFPAVAILIPARHEPKDVLESTLSACCNLSYPHKTVYLLDDSSDEVYKKEAEELSKKYGYGALLFRRSQRHGAKAGIINDCLKNLTEEYIAIFDVDQNPISDFLSKVVPIIEADPLLAFVQTPQFYSNLELSKVSFASNMQQAVFYEYICEGKSSNQAMICCGTNVIIRRKALIDVGGLDESTVTEDFATSIKLHLKGWKSLYYNHVHTFGMGPRDLGAYFKQQNRWAMGNVGVLKAIIASFLRHPFVLSPLQWLEYIATGSYYFIGWFYLFLVFCPITYIFFNIPSFFMNPVVYTFTYIPYLMLSMAIFYTSMGFKYYSVRQLVKGQILSFITLPVYARASLFSVMGVKGYFQVTAKEGTRRIPYAKLWPQILVWSISLIAITWGAHRMIYERNSTIMINVIWVAYHFLLLSGIFYFNEEDVPSIYRKRLLKKIRFEYRIVDAQRQLSGPEGGIGKICFSVILPEPLKTGTLMMCKVYTPDKRVIIFDAQVMWPSVKRWFGGYQTGIDVVTALEDDKEELKKLIEK